MFLTPLVFSDTIITHVRQIQTVKQVCQLSNLTSDVTIAADACRAEFWNYITGGRPSTSVNGDITIQWEWSNFDPHRIKTP